MKSKRILASMVLVLSLALTACGGKSADIKNGATAMRKEVTALKAAVDAGDAAKIRQLADETEEAWEKFEDAVKEHDKAAYAKVEEPLGAIAAAAKEATPDKKLLTEQVAKLDAVLSDLTK